MTVQRSRRPEAIIQLLPVKPIFRGSGGAAPDGRRRRRRWRACAGPVTGS